MVDLILTTFDWVPETPRGYVRDLRVRWALEEAALPYRVESTPFRGRGLAHFAHQPFGRLTAAPRCFAFCKSQNKSVCIPSLIVRIVASPKSAPPEEKHQ